MIAWWDKAVLGACECGAMCWREGPEGGLSQMFKCGRCGAKYVLHPGRRVPVATARMTDSQVTAELLKLTATDDPEVALGWVVALKLAHKALRRELTCAQQTALSKVADILHHLDWLCKALDAQGPGLTEQVQFEHRVSKDVVAALKKEG